MTKLYLLLALLAFLCFLICVPKDLFGMTLDRMRVACLGLALITLVTVLLYADRLGFL